MILSETFNVNVISVFKLVKNIKETGFRYFGFNKSKSVVGLFNFIQLDVTSLWNDIFLNLNERLGAVRNIALNRAIGIKPVSVFKLTELF
jgi:hypothetical protein